MIKLTTDQVTILEALSQPIVEAQNRLNAVKLPFDLYLKQVREQLGAEEGKFDFVPEILSFVEKLDNVTK